MNLAVHQRKLLSLFRCSYQPAADDDAYIQKVAQSKDLEEARRNIFLWRIYVLERTCFLTFTLLKRRNLLEETLSAFIARRNISPFRETQAPAFLEALQTHPDKLIASVAQFELALRKVRNGDPGFYVVRWNVEPHAILHSLARDVPLDEKLREGAYEIFVSRDLPGQFQIASLRADEEAGIQEQSKVIHEKCTWISERKHFASDSEVFLSPPSPPHPS